MDPSLLITMLTITPGLIKFADDQIQDLQGIEELDDFQQRFANTFEVNLKQELDKEVDSNGIVSKFESNREEILATLGDEHVVDVDSVVETITAQLTDYVVGDMDTEAVNRKEVRSAVEDAYLHTLDEISKAIPESDRHRLNNELNRKLKQDIEDIDETLEIIKQTLKDVGRRDRQESFRIERSPMGIESLVADKLSRALDEERTFHEPPGFDSHNDRRYVLIYGRKGSGKTRVLTEQAKSLIESQEFDAVVYLDRGFRDFADLESLLQIEYDGDVLLLWDDAHDIGDRDFVKDVLIKFDAYLDGTQDNDLWVRMTARRDNLDAVLQPGQHPDDESTPSHTADITPQNVELGTLPVDTDEHFDRDTISQIVEEALRDNGLSDPDELCADFVRAVMEYEPTPAYVESACRTIAEEDTTLHQSHIESLPASTLEFWKQAYAELRHHSRYGESRQAILKSLSLLNWMNADEFKLPLVRVLSREALGSTEDFRADLKYLQSRGWLTIRDSTDRIEIHDIRLEAIDTPTNDPQVIKGVSTVLEDMASNDRIIAPELSEEYIAKINTSFAKRLQHDDTPKVAEKHFKRALRMASTNPQRHLSYADFLGSEGREYEAEVQRETAKELRSSRGAREYEHRTKDLVRQLRKNPPEEPPAPSTHRRVSRSPDEITMRGAGEKTRTDSPNAKRNQHGEQPPSQKELFIQSARMDQHILKQKVQALEEIIQAEGSESAAVDHDLFAKLRRASVDIDDELEYHIQTPETPSGIITNILQVKDNKSKGYDVATKESEARATKTKLSAVRDVYEEEFDSSDDTPYTEDPHSLELLVVVDTGQTLWLLQLSKAAATNVIDTSVGAAEEVAREKMSFDPIIAQIKETLIHEYCHVLQSLDDGSDEMVVGDGTEIDATIPVDCTNVYPAVTSMEPAPHHKILTRVTIEELQAATETVRGVQAQAQSGGVLLPSGGYASEVCLCGQITKAQTKDSEYWWAELEDVLGDSIVMITEDYTQNEYQDITPEEPVMVRGIPTPVRPTDGTTKIGIEVNSISHISWASCLLIGLEIGERTVDRIDNFDDHTVLNELSRQLYDIESAEDLQSYRETAERITHLLS